MYLINQDTPELLLGYTLGNKIGIEDYWLSTDWGDINYPYYGLAINENGITGNPYASHKFITQRLAKKHTEY